MIVRKAPFLWYKINGVARFVMVHFMAEKLPLYLVNEYPKSGGTWLAQMLGEALELPFPRNRLPIFESSIMHGHYCRFANMKNVVIIWRDFRDVVVSMYFHSLFYNERGNRKLVEKTREKTDFTDYGNIRENLPGFIRYLFENKGHPGFTWPMFVRRWAGRKDVCHVKYEELLSDAEGHLIRLARQLAGKNLPLAKARKVAFKYSFAQMSGRKPGEEDRSSFMRKGISGDWKNHFNRDARELLAFYAGKELVTLRYETDDRWVREY